jgi:VWFA-related protein
MLVRLPRVLPAIVLAALLSSTCALAQQDGEGEETMSQSQGQMDPAIPSLVPAAPPSGSRTIHLSIVVAPKPGAAPVAGLLQSEFVVRDNNVTQSIQSFHAVSGGQAPAEIVLVIDAVNASYQRMPYERQQIAAFLRDNGGKLAHPTAIAILSDTGIQMQPEFSTNGNALADFVDHVSIPIRSIGRSAGFYGADDRFQKSIRGFITLMTRVDPDPGRKLVVWISPGWPFLSGPRTSLDKRSQQNLFDSIVAVSTRMRQAGVTLYSVSPAFGGSTENIFYYKQFLKPMEKPSQVQVGNLGVQVLAEQSGGLVLNSSNDLAGYLRTAVADSSVYYELSFDPAAAERDGEYRKLDVTVTRPGLVARTRAGYYSQK